MLCISILLPMVPGVACLWPSVTFASPPLLPVEKSVMSGEVTLARTDAKAMQLLQHGPRAVMEWHSFDIAHGAKVEIKQPSPLSLMINRVVGDTMSTIGGDLVATGSIVLINPNGIALERSANIETASFVASSVALTDRDVDSMFAAWRATQTPSQHATEGHPQMVPARRAVFPQLTLQKAGSGVSSGGTIKTLADGNVGLIGQFVHHDGVIIADGGQVAVLGLGSTLSTVSRPTRALSNLAAAAQASVGGPPGTSLSQADASASAAAASKMGSSTRQQPDRTTLRIDTRAQTEETVNISGTIRTGTVMPVLENPHGGRIAVDGRDGMANLSGVLMASVGQRIAHGLGGRVSISAKQVNLRSALVDVRGAVRGGAIVLSTSSDRAIEQKMHVDAKSTLNAQALGTGNGGDIYVVSAGETQFDGAAVASGERILSPHRYPGAGLAVSSLLRRHTSVTLLGEGGSVAVTGRSGLQTIANIDVSSAQGSTKGRVHLHGPETVVEPTGPGFAADAVPASASASASASVPPEVGHHQPSAQKGHRRHAWGLNVNIENILKAEGHNRPLAVTPIPEMAPSGARVAAVLLPVAAQSTAAPSKQGSNARRPGALRLAEAGVAVRIPEALPTETLPNMVSEITSNPAVVELNHGV